MTRDISSLPTYLKKKFMFAYGILVVYILQSLLTWLVFLPIRQLNAINTYQEEFLLEGTAIYAIRGALEALSLLGAA